MGGADTIEILSAWADSWLGGLSVEAAIVVAILVGMDVTLALWSVNGASEK